ncbi:hypothetical protein V8E36_006985 [Tilletia maclaganii]
MSSYAQLALDPFCSLDASHAAIVRSHGRRQCWPQPGYDISSAIVKMLSSADSAAAAFDYFCQSESIHNLSELQHLANAIVPQLAVLLLCQDLGLDRAAARKLLYEGGLYGRLVFPLLPSLPQPQQQHSPQPQPASPSPLDEIPQPPNPPEPEPSNLALPPRKVVSAAPSSEVLSHEEFFEIQAEDADIPPQLEQVTSSIPLSLSKKDVDHSTPSKPQLAEAGIFPRLDTKQPLFKIPSPPPFKQVPASTQFAPPSYWKGFGRHAVGKIIGGGSQGSILECTDRLTGLSLVIKMARFTSTGHPPIPMLREIHALRKAEHPNLLYLQAVLYDGIQIGLVLPRASQDLKTVIDDHYRQGLQAGAIKLYMKQLLSGMAYLHDKIKLLHLDLKPENLLLNYDHRLRIADFGLARDIGPAGRQRTVVTLAYRAPEVYFRVDRFSDAVDIFSAGVILQEMLDGIPWAKSAYAPLHCFEHMLDALGCGRGELWPGADQLPGLWHGQDGAGDDPAFLAKAGRRHFTPRPRELPSSAARYKEEQGVPGSTPQSRAPGVSYSRNFSLRTPCSAQSLDSPLELRTPFVEHKVCGLHSVLRINFVITSTLTPYSVDEFPGNSPKVRGNLTPRDLEKISMVDRPSSSQAEQ